MGSDVPFRVKVLKVFEAEMVVYALTEQDAKEEAERQPNVVKALEADPIY